MLQMQELSEALDEIESEPSKNTKLSKLRQSLEEDYKKRLLEHVDKDDTNLLKNYFNKLLNLDNLTTTNVTTELTNYMEDSDNEPNTNLIKNIMDEVTSKKISIDDFSNFMEGFLNQNFPIDIFYKNYYKKRPLPSLDDESKPLPSKVDLFGEMTSSEEESSSSSSSSSSEDEEDEEDRLQKVRQRIEEKREDPRLVQVIEPVPEKRCGKVAVIKDSPVPRPKVPEPKPIADKIFFETMADLTKKDCEFLYKKIPWVKDIVNHIYIHPLEGEFEDVIDYNEYIEYDGKKFYQPKQKYYSIQCHSNKVQKGHELTIIKNGETHKLMVAVDTNTRGIVLQNEDMLKAEIDYVRVWNQNKNEHIKELMRNKPNEDMVLLAKFDLSKALQDAIGGNVPIAYRSGNSEFIENVVRTIYKNSNTGESFVRLLANIIIFLKINISFITSSVFIKRLREQIYLPGTLPFLTDADKLPEIFMVKNVPENTRNFVLEKLEEERLHFTKNFFENIHIGSSMLRKPTRPILWNKPTMQIELPDLKSICKNRDQIEDENDEDIVFYTDLDEVYCFNVYKLYDLFRKEDVPINPYTRQPFSDRFIQSFLTRYASKPLVKKIEEEEHVDLTTKLENLIEKELSFLENSLIETENPDFIERFKSSIAPQQEMKKRISRVDGGGENRCLECKKELGSDKITSVFRNKQVYFCGYDCLEKNKAFK